MCVYRVYFTYFTCILYSDPCISLIIHAPLSHPHLSSPPLPPPSSPSPLPPQSIHCPSLSRSACKSLSGSPPVHFSPSQDLFFLIAFLPIILFPLICLSHFYSCSVSFPSVVLLLTFRLLRNILVVHPLPIPNPVIRYFDRHLILACFLLLLSTAGCCHRYITRLLHDPSQSWLYITSECPRCSHPRPPIPSSVILIDTSFSHAFYYF